MFALSDLMKREETTISTSALTCEREGDVIKTEFKDKKRTLSTLSQLQTVLFSTGKLSGSERVAV